MEIKKYQDLNYGGSNTYVIKYGNKAIIIDAGVTLETFINDLQGYTVEAIFITHAHFDHIYYLESYMEEFRPDLYISDLGYQKLYNSTKNMSLWFKEALLEEDPESNYNEIELTNKYEFIPLTDGSKFYFDNLVVDCNYTPGHSNDSFTFVVNESVAFVGDLIFKNGVGRTDFYDGDSKALVQSIQKLKKYPKLRTIHSGHGESTSI